MHKWKKNAVNANWSSVIRTSNFYSWSDFKWILRPTFNADLCIINLFVSCGDIVIYICCFMTKNCSVSVIRILYFNTKMFFCFFVFYTDICLNLPCYPFVVHFKAYGLNYVQTCVYARSPCDSLKCQYFPPLACNYFSPLHGLSLI